MLASGCHTKSMVLSGMPLHFHYRNGDYFFCIVSPAGSLCLCLNMPIVVLEGERLRLGRYYLGMQSVQEIVGGLFLEEG